MYKHVIIFLFLVSSLSANAQSWSDTEIQKLQNFSIKSLKSIDDPSNRYLNNQNAIDLGKSLFNDTRLSSNDKVSCSSCHLEEYAFTDNKKLAIGLREGFRNTSTLLNIGQQHWFFADGAKDSLWTQALSSIENPAEQNFTRMEMMHLISTDQYYRQQYQRIFGTKLLKQTTLNTYPLKAGPNAKLKDLIAWKKLNREQRQKVNLVFTNIGKAIASFVSTIQSKPSRFDSFIDELTEKSESTHLSISEQRGLRLFLSQESGCINCHSGPLFSNKTFHDIGTGIPGKDNGRSEVIESLVRDEFNCLSKYSDAKPDQCTELNYINRNKHQLNGAYKTSTLRSIGKTAPYIHDGRFDDLNEVIKHYISISQSKTKKTDLTRIKLDEKQQSDLVNFLLTL
ncbi:MAG: cytochrome c peroxidase [Cocleimonas sp.]|jgi:cytochrome c peroxidase